MNQDFAALFSEALKRRQALQQSLLQEGTDAWRVLHGIVEGRPGLTVDRYGSLLLAQVFFNPILDEEESVLRDYAASQDLELVIWNKYAQAQERQPYSYDPELVLCHEQGQPFYASRASFGSDPYLYLDFRAGRRWLRANATAEDRVLNLFAYTCTAASAALTAGGKGVNVDFGRRCLQLGRSNAVVNGQDGRTDFWQEDIFPILWQLSGIGVKGRAARHRYMRVKAEKFSLIILDPPNLAKTPFGKVDLLNDYPAMFKPCLLSAAPGGRILALNHLAEVPVEKWLASLQRTAEKISVELAKVELLDTEADFPTFDGRSPLKMAVVTLA